MTYRGYKGVDGVNLDLRVTHPDQINVQQPTVEDTQSAQDEIFLTRRNTEDGEMIVFVKERLTFGLGEIVETKTLAEVPIEAVRMAAITLTKLREHVPTASIMLSPNENYSVMLNYWRGDSKIGVGLFEGDTIIGLVHTWDLDDIKDN